MPNMSKISLILVLLFSLPLGACAKEIPNKEIQEILDIEPVTKTNVQTELDIPKSVEEGKKEKLKPSVLENSLQNTALANSEQGIAQSEVSSTPLVKVTEKKVIAAAESPKTARVDKRVQTQTQEKTAAQEMLNLDQYKGKVVYLDFWASWCEPCQQTFPWMDAMQKKYPDDIVFIAVNFGENPEDTQEFLKRFPADIKFVFYLWSSRRFAR